MAFEAPSFDLGFDSDTEDLLKLVVEDSLEKDGEAADHLEDVEMEVDSHRDVKGRKRNFKHKFDLNEVPSEGEGVAEAGDLNGVPNEAQAEPVLDLNKLPNEMLNVQDEIEEELVMDDNEEELERHDNEDLNQEVYDMLRIYIDALP